MLKVTIGGTNYPNIHFFSFLTANSLEFTRIVKPATALVEGQEVIANLVEK